MRRLILGGVLFFALASTSTTAAGNIPNNNSKTLNERGHEDIFNPAVAAAAFKVGLANVASSSSNTRPASHKRANAFGKHGVDGGGHKKNKKRTPQVLGDLLGDDGDVLNQDGAMAVVNVLLEGGTLTYGSVSTVRVVPTTYITTSEGERTTVTDRVTVHIVPTPSASSSSSSSSSLSSWSSSSSASASSDSDSDGQSISSRTPINYTPSSSSSYTPSSSSSTVRSSSSSSPSSSYSAPSSSSSQNAGSSSASSSSSRPASSSSSPSVTPSSSSTRTSSSASAPSSSSSSTPASSASPSSSSSSSRVASNGKVEATSSSSSSSSSSGSASSASSSASPPPSSSASSSATPSTSSSSVATSESSSERSTSSSSSVVVSSDVESSSATPSSSSASSSSSSSEAAITSRTPLVPGSSSSTTDESSSSSSSSSSASSVDSTESLTSATLPLASYDTTSSSSSSEVESTPTTSQQQSSVFEPSETGALAVNTTRTRSEEEATSSTVSTRVSEEDTPTSTTIRSGEETTRESSTVVTASETLSSASSSETSSVREGDEEITPTRTWTSDVGNNSTRTVSDEEVTRTSGGTTSTRGAEEDESSTYPQATPTDRPADSNGTTTTSYPNDSETTTRPYVTKSDITTTTRADYNSGNGTTTIITSTRLPDGNNATISDTSEDGNTGPTVTLSDTDGGITTTTRGGNGTFTGTATATETDSLSTATNTANVTSTETTEGETTTSDPYAWVPTSALLANSAVPTTTETTTSVPSESISDSDEDGSSNGEATSTSSSFAPFPSEWPSVIVPTNTQMLTSKQQVPSGNTLISILFTEDLSWAWLCANGDASAQVFAFMPSLIATAINISSAEVITDKLVAYQPENYDGSTGTILSVYLGYIPTSYVDALSAAIKAPNSAFYTRTAGIPLQLSKVVNPTLPIMAYAQQGVSNSAVEAGAVNGSIEDGNTTISNSASEKKKTIIIAVTTSIGVFALAVLAFFAIKAARKNKGTSAAAAANMRSPNMQNGLRGFHLQGDRNAYSSGGAGGPMMQQRGQSGTLSRMYGFATGQQPIWATQQSHNNRYDPAAQQNPFRISGYSDSSASGSDQSHGSSAFSHSSDGNGGYNGNGYTPAQWTGGPSHSHHYATQQQHQRHAGASGRSSSIDFNSVDQDEVRNSWWRFSDGFGRAFSSPLTSGQHSPDAVGTAATSPISATSAGRAHVRNSARRVNIQRGPRGDLSGAISRPQMQENSLML